MYSNAKIQGICSVKKNYKAEEEEDKQEDQVASQKLLEQH